MLTRSSNRVTVVLVADDAPRDWLIVDTRAVDGNCCLFWKPDRRGYTSDLMQAGRYTEAEARAQERERETDMAVPLVVAMEHAVTHVQQDRLRTKWPFPPASSKPKKPLAKVRERTT